jgi:uncharacterized protein (TIGR02996 family)
VRAAACDYHPVVGRSHRAEGAMRKFTCTAGKSNKFWDIELKGKSFTVTWGRVGSAGQSLTKSFKDEEAARTQHDKLVEEKLAKGYVETTSAPAAAARPQPGLRQALEEALVANPDDLAAHMAYSDYLQEQGDPRGEFIQVQLALEDEKRSAEERKQLRQRERKLLKAHQRQWLGELAPFLLDEDEDLELSYYVQERGAKRAVDFRFRRGWLDQLCFHKLTLEAGRAMKKASACRLLRDLAVEDAHDEAAVRPSDIIPERGFQQGLWPLSQSPFLANVRRFRLGLEEGDDYGRYHCAMFPVPAAALARRMPRLEEFYLFACEAGLAELFALKSLHHLRILQIYHNYEVHRLDILAKNPSLRGLTHLLIHPHCICWHRNGQVDEAAGYREAEGYLPLSVVRPLLRSPNLPSLTHLRLRVCSMGDEGCTEIVRSGILGRLKSLDLRHGRIIDEGARTLAACPDIRRLEWLDLSRNAVGTDGVAVLRQLRIPVRLDDQHEPTEGGQADLDSGGYLYEGEQE